MPEATCQSCPGMADYFGTRSPGCQGQESWDDRGSKRLSHPLRPVAGGSQRGTCANEARVRIGRIAPPLAVLAGDNSDSLHTGRRPKSAVLRGESGRSGHRPDMLSGNIYGGEYEREGLAVPPRRGLCRTLPNRIARRQLGLGGSTGATRPPCCPAVSAWLLPPGERMSGL